MAGVCLGGSWEGVKKGGLGWSESFYGAQCFTSVKTGKYYQPPRPITLIQQMFIGMLTV